ncbi:jg16832 [Pararge aegeria aegeria]|uniref:Jg16832 protein n=1 Tax=Pararge aegeria aegeria TaxID=348720 RepID=A0A8S4SBZ5_9NEOP|nr:jg16832 [Pararge aegeria aegeria]
MGGTHSSENRWLLGSQVVGMATGKRSVGRPPTRWTVKSTESLETSCPGPWIMERPTKDQCPAVEVRRTA